MNIFKVAFARNQYFSGFREFNPDPSDIFQGRRSIKPRPPLLGKFDSDPLLFFKGVRRIKLRPLLAELKLLRRGGAEILLPPLHKRGYRGEELLALIGLCLVRSTMRKPQDNPTRLLSSLYCLFILHCRSEARTVPLIISSHRFFAFMLGCLQILHIKQASRLLLRSCKTYPVI
ncbi:hypothetical protein DAI22_11g009800 [Oryza sativa Japonica Group]|nr:hypothetical protein DAI22_11g009800 [Oryza sativa Japonica Group]